MYFTIQEFHFPDCSGQFIQEIYHPSTRSISWTVRKCKQTLFPIVTCILERGRDVCGRISHSFTTPTSLVCYLPRFNVTIYDYCNKHRFRETARELLVEADISLYSVPPPSTHVRVYFSSTPSAFYLAVWLTQYAALQMAEGFRYCSPQKATEQERMMLLSVHRYVDHNVVNTVLTIFTTCSFKSHEPTITRYIRSTAFHVFRFRSPCQYWRTRVSDRLWTSLP